jgi:hypothetical protein
MKLISHRGNTNGPSNLQNHPDQIEKVLSLGFDCEIDLWFNDNKYFLGHDYPQFEVDEEFLELDRLWIHCKNLAALENCPIGSNYFWHQDDDRTLTSKGYIWTFPNQKVGKKSIIVDNDKNWKSKNYDCFGVCSDYILY